MRSNIDPLMRDLAVSILASLGIDVRHRIRRPCSQLMIWVSKSAAVSQEARWGTGGAKFKVADLLSEPARLHRGIKTASNSVQSEMAKSFISWR